MEGILVLLALVALAIPFVVVWLMVAVARLKRRVERLEQEVHRAEATGVPAPRPTTSPWPTAEPQPVPVTPAAGPSIVAADGDWGLPPDVPAGPPRPAEHLADVSAPADPPAPRRDWIGGFANWVQANWIYLVSALSLGLAGIFLVQYGAEHGLLTPGARILLAMGLGAALIVAGETIRRRWGDEGRTSTAALPSTFSAAGIVILYAAVIAARSLYGLIGPEVAFAGLLAVSLVALVFGWFYGPFLAAAGLTGGAAAPFLVGGEAGGPALMFIYFGLLGGAGLAIDAMRRWGWVSTLALVLALGGGSLARGALGGQEGYLALLLWLALAAVAVPRLELWPSHPGPSVLEALLRSTAEPRVRPVAPTWIAAGAVAAVSTLILLSSLQESAGAQLLSLGALVGLAVGLILWTERAEGVEDLPLVPSALLLAAVPMMAQGHLALFREFLAFDPAANPEASPPWTVTLLLALAVLVSGAAFWRSFRGSWPELWAAAAALVAPVAAVLLDLSWHPALVIGPWPWALHIIALAGLMTGAAGRYAAADGEDRRRAAYATLSALSLIALAFFVLLSEAALTVALSVLVAVAAGLDRRFRLPEMSWFILAGIAALGWRLTVDPGLPAYLGQAGLGEAVLAYGAALLGLGSARALLPAARRYARAALEGAFLATAGVFATVLLWRFVERVVPGASGVSHWAVSLLGLIWMALALAQLHRAWLGGALRRVRLGLATVEGLLAGVCFAAVLTGLNPFVNLWERVLGPQPLDTLLVAYALPALVFAVLALRLTWLPRRRLLLGAAGVFGAMWLFLALRRFWRGNEMLGAAGFTQAELTSYTVALLVAGGLLLLQALRRRSAGLRRLAMAVIALAIAKVFLVDAAGLGGLLRVFSFLGLGLVLAGLAWLNRWASGPPEQEAA